jgi:acyl carrier protein
VDEVASRIRTYIADELIVKHGVELADDTPLLNGLVDSLGLQRLVSFIEEEFDVTLDHLDMTPENFGTINDIDRLVETKLGGRSAPEAAVG